MKNRLLAPFAISVAAAAALMTASPALAAEPWPTDGKFVVGSAQWQLDDYGLAYAWDAADVYDPAGYMYYPMELFMTAGDFDTYIKCGLNGEQANSVITTEANGDVVIECPTFEVATDVLGQLRFRIYAAESNGWLIRQEAIITNNTGAQFNIENIGSYQYIEGYVFGGSTDSTFLTSSNKTDPTTVASDDSFFISSYNDGSSVNQSTAWAKTGSAATEAISTQALSGGNDYITNDYGARTVAPNSSIHVIQFTNMNIPAEKTESATTAAFTSAETQAPEFASFSGRLVAGLDPETYYIGWGIPQDVPVPPNPVNPALAKTGSDATHSGLTFGIAFLALAMGAAVTVVRAKKS